jgi:hypothetical protein
VRVELWTDIICPWCGLGSRLLETALARFGHQRDVELVRRSFDSLVAIATEQGLDGERARVALTSRRYESMVRADRSQRACGRPWSRSPGGDAREAACSDSSSPDRQASRSDAGVPQNAVSPEAGTGPNAIERVLDVVGGRAAILAAQNEAITSTPRRFSAGEAVTDRGLCAVQSCWNADQVGDSNRCLEVEVS